MSRALRWSRDALDDLKAQVAFIAAENPGAARRVAEAVRATAAALSEMPTGRPGRLSGTYEKPVAGLPYLVAYALAPWPDGGEAVVILRVVHTARDWPPGGWPRGD